VQKNIKNIFDNAKNDLIDIINAIIIANAYHSGYLISLSFRQTAAFKINSLFFKQSRPFPSK